MTLKERIDADIRSAMLARDNVRKEILKFIKSEIQRKEGGLAVMDDADVQRLMKGQAENLKITPSETSQKEIEILEGYLPQLMSEEQIRSAVSELIAGGSNNVGAIMKHFSTTLKGKADNATVSRITKELLQ